MNENIISFPSNKIVREVPINHEALEIAREKGLTNFADGVTDSLIENLMVDIDNAGIDTETDTFMRDMSLTVESLRATIYRTFGIEHHLHNFIDNNVKVVKKGGTDEEAENVEEDLTST